MASGNDPHIVSTEISSFQTSSMGKSQAYNYHQPNQLFKSKACIKCDLDLEERSKTSIETSELHCSIFSRIGAVLKLISNL